MDETVVADTGVVSYLTKPLDPLAVTYRRMIGSARIALSFQSVVELVGADFSSRRLAIFGSIRRATIRLPHTEATDPYYSLVTQMRQQLRRSKSLGSDASDADAWIIASALEYGLALVSHDRQQVALARAAGVEVHSALSGLRAGNPR